MREDVSDNSVVLRYGDGEYTYPVVDSTVGDKGFDIGKLRAQTGLVTLDSGYGNTAAYKSAVTYLDGEAGILRYRGYPIEQLAERSTFLEVAYLLLKGGVTDLKHQMDSEEYGGSPFLGAKQPVIKARGSSKAKGIKNAIRQAKICVENDLCGTMQKALDELSAPAAD